MLAILSQGSLDALPSFRLNGGDLLVILSMAMWSVYTICLRWRPPGLHLLSFLFVLACVGDLACCRCSLGEFALGPAHDGDAGEHRGAGRRSRCSRRCSRTSSGTAASSRSAPTSPGLFVHLMPVFGVVLAWLFLGERLALYHRRRHRADPGRHLDHQPDGPPRRGRAGGDGLIAVAAGGEAETGVSSMVDGGIGDPRRVELMQRLVQLTLEHRDLDDLLHRLSGDRSLDQVQIQRLKRRKLLLKDQIVWLSREMDPDVPA